MENIIPQKEWSVAIRYNHWIMAFSVFVLIVTGFYIAFPVTISTGDTYYKYFMGNMRTVHILFGVILLFVFLWRLYLAVFSRFLADWKDFFAWANLENTVRQVKFYLLVSKERPVHTHRYGPLQALAYSGLFVMVFLVCLTGLILMGAGYDAGWTAAVYKVVKPFEILMGGLAGVRYLHHVLTWGFVLFIVAHVYMAFWYDVIFDEGTVSSMISGTVFHRDDH